ncbi:MAG TPA: selenocysteine-specific translation elongation factor [Firmicutes bacterium]|nr:selenocysteine-specific translation elongation factor [Bacillota bacterium]
MKHVVIGTAGHVDHGKTSLIKALTGIDTDRLKEEKERGMTIDLGFAPLHLPGQKVVSIVDVPGHERFTKNMVAGVTGIDMFLLVIAADEGVMDQTREHVNILSLLDITTGVVALTKIDLVDEEFLELVNDEVGRYLQETRLAHSRIIPVSSVTGRGIPDLVSEINRLVESIPSRSSSDVFRLPVDRVFTISGYGTVITGTVIGGVITQGEAVEVLPSHKTARVRGIQVHDNKVDRAIAGDRAAINLAGIEKGEIQRGDVVVRPGTLRDSTVIDAAVTAIEGEGGVSHGQRVRVHVGCAEVMARVRILGRDMIPGGERGYVQLRFEGPAAVARGDRFIIRSFSPMRTIAGGRILMHDAPERRRFSTGDLETLAVEDSGPPEVLLEYLLKRGPHPGAQSIKEISMRLLCSPEDVRTLALGPARDRVAVLEGTQKLVAREILRYLRRQIVSALEDFHAKSPLRPGMPKDALRMAVAPRWEQDDFDELMEILIQEGTLSRHENLVDLAGIDRHTAILKRPEVSGLEAAYKSQGLAPQRLENTLAALGLDSKTGQEALSFLLEIGHLVRIGEGIILHKDAVEMAKSIVKRKLEEQGSIGVGEIRDALGTTRKIAVPLLEYFDQIGLTRRAGDLRQPGPHFRAAHMDRY